MTKKLIGDRQTENDDKIQNVLEIMAAKLQTELEQTDTRRDDQTVEEIQKSEIGRRLEIKIKLKEQIQGIQQDQIDEIQQHIDKQRENQREHRLPRNHWESWRDGLLSPAGLHSEWNEAKFKPCVRIPAAVMKH